MRPKGGKERLCCFHVPFFALFPSCLPYPTFALLLCCLCLLRVSHMLPWCCPCGAPVALPLCWAGIPPRCVCYPALLSAFREFGLVLLMFCSFSCCLLCFRLCPCVLLCCPGFALRHQRAALEFSPVCFVFLCVVHAPQMCCI